MLDPLTADEFFAAMDPKSLFEKMCDWLQETSIYKFILASKLRGFISNMIYFSRKKTIFSWIFKPEIRNLIFSFSGKTLAEMDAHQFFLCQQSANLQMKNFRPMSPSPQVLPIIQSANFFSLVL